MRQRLPQRVFNALTNAVSTFRATLAEPPPNDSPDESLEAIWWDATYQCWEDSETRAADARIVCTRDESGRREWLDRDAWLQDDDMAKREKRVRLGQSPFFAAAVAIHLGFETIGLIGVDLTEDRYPDVSRENESWRRLAELAGRLGSRLVNLSPTSRLETVTKGDWTDVRKRNDDPTLRRL